MLTCRESLYKEVENAWLEARKDAMEKCSIYSAHNLSYWLLLTLAIYRLLRCDNFRSTIEVGVPFI